MLMLHATGGTRHQFDPTSRGVRAAKKSGELGSFCSVGWHRSKGRINTTGVGCDSQMASCSAAATRGIRYFCIFFSWQSTERAMPVEELPSFRGHRRRPDERQRDRADGSARSFLHHLDQEPFQQGYIAGWQSVRGADNHPLLIPLSPVFVGQAMYMVGFSRGARDAGQ
jgi:hypothetical protein